MAQLAAIGPAAMQIGGTLVKGFGDIQEGEAARAMADSEAGALRREGAAALASSQRAAIAEREKKDAAVSTARAIAGKGGDVSDIANIEAGLEERGLFNMLSQLYEGKTRRQGLEDQAKRRKFEGRQAARAGYLKAFSTLLEGASSFAGNFGGAGAPSGGASAGASGASMPVA